MAETNWVGQIGSELERIFRYLLPGITILGFARLSHPSWFCWVQVGSSQHLVVLGAIALCAGASWYVAHRYSLHQVIDVVFYYCVLKKGDRRDSYSDWLAEHVADSLRTKKRDAALRHNIGLRSAQIIYLFVTAEAGILFSFFCPETCSFFGEHKFFIAIVSVLISLVALVQQRLGYKIDLHAVATSDKGSLGW